MAVAHQVGVVHGVSVGDDRARHPEKEGGRQQNFEKLLQVS
jgi:hypothetical protein